MLVAEISINLERPVEDIFIHNIGDLGDGFCEYEIMDPLSPKERLVEETIKHKRENGYRSLLIKVLQLLESRRVSCNLERDLRDFRAKNPTEGDKK